MQISSVPPVELLPPGPARAPRNALPVAASSPTATQQTIPVDSFTSSAQATTAATTAPPPASSSAPAEGALALAAQIAAGISEAATLAASYSTTVGGKNYSGSVTESGGTYTASVGNLPGVSASGSSVQSAEDNLVLRIDALV